MPQSTILGYPRIGRRRELKKATEAYWAGKATAEELQRTGREIRLANWKAMKDAGLDRPVSGDFSFYDQMLDATAMVGAVPERYGWKADRVDLDTYFRMARGAQGKGVDVRAMDMTKFFDTNYHFIVPELHQKMSFRLASTKAIDEFEEARKEGVNARPVLMGPVTYLLLGHVKDAGLKPLETLLDPLLSVYAQVIERLASAGAEWIQIDEPAFACDRASGDYAALRHAYDTLVKAKGKSKLLLATYFGALRDGFDRVTALPVDGLALDFVRGASDLETIKTKGWPKGKVLCAGVVDGRNVWLCDLESKLATLEVLAKAVGKDNLWVSSSSSLAQVPQDVTDEQHLDEELRAWMAFARQKLDEIVVLSRALGKGKGSVKDAFAANARALEARRKSPRTVNPAVRERLAKVTEADLSRHAPFGKRKKQQWDRLKLPPFPTTTIGSFPQTEEVRRMRAKQKSGELTGAAYDAWIEGEIRKLVKLQEEIGLDVLVHGEFERSDMVEYFAELLEGYAFTRHGWVQSYGTRYVRPPVLFGDVSRPKPMTVRWSTYAQSLSTRPMKGMLTGPVTILNWSFVRDDQPRSESCRQIALALRDEVLDLEHAGIKIIQIDEPAIREGLPLLASQREAYLRWAVDAFRLVAGKVKDDTQIQTHMCYSDFGDILAGIDRMDADVLLIENSRSDQELLGDFKRFKYGKDIGPGVYDVHSPRVPPVQELVANLEASCKVLAPEQVWVNPDCGLKTRGYDETLPTLRNMVAAARSMRGKTAAPPAGH